MESRWPYSAGPRTWLKVITRWDYNMKTKLKHARSAVLLVAGTLLILIGASILLSPVDFYATNNIELGKNISLINEIKAPAGLLLVAGAFMIRAIFVRRITDTALSLAALVYLTYALSRSASMVSDGLPVTGLVQAAALEGFIGITCLLVLLASKNQPRTIV